MRGDSVRDFYAKAMALTGLGVLAAVGALVDYWPAPLGVPHVPHVASRFGAVGPLTRAIPREIPVTLGSPAAPRPVRATPKVSTSEAPEAAVATNATTDVPALPVLAASVPAPAPPSMAVESAVNVPAAVVSLSDLPPAPAPTVSSDVLANLPHMVAAVDDSDGLITGAFKKTGSSIATAGTKAGTGLATAARVVGGAFSGALKKVWF